MRRAPDCARAGLALPVTVLLVLLVGVAALWLQARFERGRARTPRARRAPVTAAAPPVARAAVLEPRLEALLGELSLQEKIGQMTMLTLRAIARRDPASGALELDPAALEQALAQHGVGAIFNVFDHALSPADWQRL